MNDLNLPITSSNPLTLCVNIKGHFWLHDDVHSIHTKAYHNLATNVQVIGRRESHNQEESFEIKFGEVAEVLEGLKLHT